MKLLPLPVALEELAPRVAAWAAPHPHIKAIYVFGSRFRGNARADSDLDLSIELNSPADALLADFIIAAKGWRAELSALLGCRVDLQLANQKESPKVWEYLNLGCAVIYQRHSTQRSNVGGRLRAP
jgi:predicted nucleotidyltransferase